MRVREEASASASSESASSESGWDHLRILVKRVKMHGRAREEASASASSESASSESDDGESVRLRVRLNVAGII